MKDIIDRISRLKLLVVGDIMLDQYIVGDATRISPEAPVPVVVVDHDKCALGAAANVALNAVRLGAKVEMVGKIGIDESGDTIRSLLKESGIEFDEKFSRADVSTITKTRVLVRGQQICRIDREKKKREYEIFEDDLKEAICEKIKEADAVILSDYAKGTFTDSNIKKFIDAADSNDVFISVDPKPANNLNFSNISLMTPNRAEAEQLSGISLYDDENFPANDICNAIFKKFSPKNLVVTMGADGMLIKDGESAAITIPTYAQEVFDVSGAGDTSIACLTLAMASGQCLVRAAKFANIAAGIVVAKHGTAAVSAEEMLNSRNADLLDL
jgi:D-beta-D-heptose 7-phosphate kinase/D-beta-D-heptose 1-phosphate adenosyltransferase